MTGNVGENSVKMDVVKAIAEKLVLFEQRMTFGLPMYIAYAPFRCNDTRHSTVNRGVLIY